MQEFLSSVWPAWMGSLIKMTKIISLNLYNTEENASQMQTIGFILNLEIMFMHLIHLTRI